MRDRFNNNMYTFMALVLEFFLFETFPDVPLLHDIFAVTCGIFLFQAIKYLKKV